jgi:hypothetical protein
MMNTDPQTIASITKLQAIFRGRQIRSKIERIKHITARRISDLVPPEPSTPIFKSLEVSEAEDVKEREMRLRKRRGVLEEKLFCVLDMINHRLVTMHQDIEC